MLNDEDSAFSNSKRATISIAIGTKLMVTPASNWVFCPHDRAKAHQRRRRSVRSGGNDSGTAKGKVIIVNPQATPHDNDAGLVIHHKAEPFFEALTKALKVECN